ncbi:MAG: AAA family ATPase [Acidobacteriota bacterium]|nr:AAA family ATPase [Acidobacteriota bacterium]MDH3784968.1 AAA family ATPase [Acidobacteriota bacterium]
MNPVEINDYMKKDVIGQEEALRFVSVAIFKHLAGEMFGNLMLIGNSGTGKTTIMRSMEKLYSEHDEFSKYRVVIIMNANTFATEEGVIDTSRLFATLEERARKILGPSASAEQVGQYMQHATVCLDEIDKVSGMVGGKPYVTGINIQQALLTLIEGEQVVHRVKLDGEGRQTQPVTIDTSKMLFLCAGAYETLYDQVFKRVTSPTSRVKLPTETVVSGSDVSIREYFTLRDHFKQEDLFDYGMQPQFLSRFDNSVILQDLDAAMLSRIFIEPDDSVFNISREFFRKRQIDLSINDQAIQLVAQTASEARRIGARSLKEVYGRIIKPFEYDPFGREEVVKNGDGYRLLLDEGVVTRALKSSLD